MSIASEITRINNNIASAYTAIGTAGGTVPASANSANLATAIGTIPSGGGGTYVYQPHFTTTGTSVVNYEYVANRIWDGYIVSDTVFNPGNRPWEVYLKFKTVSDISTASDEYVFDSCVGTGNAGRYGICLYISNSHFVINATADGSSWSIGESSGGLGSYTVQGNRDYWVRFGYTGTQYYLDYSTNGTTYTRDITVNLSTPLYSGLSHTYLGVYSTTDFRNYWYGTIDLKECYTKIDGVETWRAVTKEDVGGAVTPGQTYMNLDKNGSVTVSSGYVATDFSTSNYLTIPYAFANKAHSAAWEIGTCIKMTTVGVWNAIFGGFSGTYLPDLYIDSANKMTMNLSSTGNSYDITGGEDVVKGTTVLSANTYYWVRYGWTGSEYYAEFSTDGVNFTREITFASSTPIESTSDKLMIGFRVGNYFHGTVDLKQTYIKVTGDQGWSAITYSECGYTELPNYEVSNGVASRREATLTADTFKNITSIGNSGMIYAFYNRTGLAGPLNLSYLTTVGNVGMQSAFYGCTGLTSVNLSSLTSIGTRGLSAAFRGCTGIQSIDLSSINLSVTTATYAFSSAFYGCTGLTSASMPALTTVAAQYAMDQMFRSCTSLTTLDLSNLVTISATRGCQNMVQECTSLTTVNLSKLKTISGGYGLYQAFYGCTSLTSMTFDKLDTLTGASALCYAFQNATGLRTLSFPKLTSSSFGSSTNQFNNMLYGITGCTVHFPSAVKTTIQSWADVTAGFGGTNTTVLFDL